MQDEPKHRRENKPSGEPPGGEPPRGPSLRQVPEGDDRERLVCPDCGFIQYDNPKVVVGSVIAEGGKILLCRRAIMPRRGFWTLPAGYLELNETPADGALREAWEEARARITLETLLAVYAIPRISQVQLIWRARLAEPGFGAGPESAEVALFAWDEIPWDAIAFPSVHWALRHFHETLGEASFSPRGNPPGETGDALPTG
jgi:ADP-ribose pyrophosphatase YjhB (NUDIX family)